MRIKTRATGFALLSLTFTCSAQEFHPDIPRAWDDKVVEALEVPLAQRDRSPRNLSAEEYYKLKVQPIYRSYPVYVKGREPAGYLESLKQKEPEIIFDLAKLHTKEDWIAAGKIVFEADIKFQPATERPAAADIPWPAHIPGPLGKNGELPFYRPGYRYIIRQKGLLESGTNASRRVPYPRAAGRVVPRRRARYCPARREFSDYRGSAPETAG